MILFLDTSVLLAACGSPTGGSRFICETGARHGWTLLSSGYCLQETLRNLPKLGDEAKEAWTANIERRLKWVSDTLSLNQALVFPKAKDRPVVITALAAQTHTLLTLDRTDFHGALGPQVYGMQLRTPSEFLIEQRRQRLL